MYRYIKRDIPKLLTFIKRNNSIGNVSLIKDFSHINLYTGSATSIKEMFINKFNFTLNSFPKISY